MSDRKKYYNIAGKSFSARLSDKKRTARAAEKGFIYASRREVNRALVSQGQAKMPTTYGGFATSEEHKADQAKEEQKKTAERTASTAKLLETRDPSKKTYLASGEVIEPTQQAVQPSPVIDIGGPKEKEKTGISKLREEDSIIGNAVRIATDWKTTVALVGTLATVATLGIATAPTAAAVVGRPAVSVLSKKAFPALGLRIGKGTQYAVNAKSKALTTSMLTKGGMTVGAAAMVATVAGTYPFANFELAEATDKIGIAIFKANEAGDLEEVARLQEYLEDMVNPSVWDSIINKIPFANVLNNVKKNVAAAQVSAKSILESTQKKLEASAAKAEEPSFAEERETSDIASRERELAEREEDEKYFSEKAEKKRETELEEREADEAYWNNIVETNAIRKADERAADEEYWKDIKAQNTSEPWTPADTKVIDDWNAGKSSLNFGWLFT